MIVFYGVQGIIMLKKKNNHFYPIQLLSLSKTIKFEVTAN